MNDVATTPTPADAMAAAARFLEGPPPDAGAAHGGASDLSIDGVLLLGAIGWEAVELVTGISWFSIPRGAWTFGKGENEKVTTAHQQAIEAAERQLVSQCTSAGGHGVVGVRLEMHTEPHHVSVEFVGTAVRPIGAAPLGEAPFTSDLSARDFVVLSRSGWRPLGFSVGVSFVFIPWRRGRGGRRITGNFELENYTNALYKAREQAMERMQSAAIALGASGIVGTNINEGALHFLRNALSFVATGTAARLEAESHRAHHLTTVLSLDDVARTFEASSLRQE